ncbi:hypothetical protein BDZ89DRAFT_1099714 [Hymenopellis radicata]|nr:hypothetical protein BDZ89DRAFT_1099714 [Hymenopellis radicata]
MPRAKQYRTGGTIRCPFRGCIKTFTNTSGRTRHVNVAHRFSQLSAAPGPTAPTHTTPSPSPSSSPPPDFRGSTPSPSPPRQSPPPPVPKSQKIYHPYLNGQPCDKTGVDLPPNSPPPAPGPLPPKEEQYAPFADDVLFDLADFLYKDVEMSQGKTDQLMRLLERWSQRFVHDPMEAEAPFVNHADMQDQIDAIPLGSAPWKCLVVKPPANLPNDAPEWRKEEYQVWYRDADVVLSNILANPDFAKEFDAAPYVHLDVDEKRCWSDFMSGNFAYTHATRIYTDDPTTKGAMLVPVIVGSDKTTVSVATGNVEYHPFYISAGNIHNAARRAHRNAVIPIAFLAIPKADRKYDNDVDFRNFKRRLFHNSIAAILRPLKPAMTTPVVKQCPDGHYRRVIYDLASYIADYPEQVLLAGVVSGWCPRCTAPSNDLYGAADPRSHEYTDRLVDEYGGDGTILWDNYGIDESVVPFTYHFPRADIHEMLTSDLLHQIIKGTFKDHLVDWVSEYFEKTETPARAKAIMDDIDRRLAATPIFPGLRRFAQGRRFKQWTGDDSKALMKIYLAAVADYVPDDIIKCLSAFLDFCYLVRRSDITEDTLTAIDDAAARFHLFHLHREVFIREGVRMDFNLPRQHSMSRHITAVKKPWRRSNRYNALSQMLLTLQRLDKLHALRMDLIRRGLLPPIRDEPPDQFDAGKEDEGAVDGDSIPSEVCLAATRQPGYPRDIDALGAYIGVDSFTELVQRFLYEDLHGDIPDNLNSDDLPLISSKVYVYHSATAYFYAPSDISGIRGMRRERIRSTPSWYGFHRRDTALVVTDETLPGFRGMSVVRVLLFFSFTHASKEYECALVHWFDRYGAHPDPKTDVRGRQAEPYLTVVSLNTMVRGVHLLPIFGPHPVPIDHHYAYSLDAYSAFYVNKYADHHANEILF